MTKEDRILDDWNKAKASKSMSYQECFEEGFKKGEEYAIEKVKKWLQVHLKPLKIDTRDWLTNSIDKLLQV